MELTFFGAARRVTGSCHMIDCGGKRVLLDCGQFQGHRKDMEMNHEPLPTESVDAVVLSHAHVDHSGRLPLICRNGYSGPIYAHPATRALCNVLLRDSGYLHEKDAQWENRKRERKGLPPIEPLYTQADGAATIAQFVDIDYGEIREILPGIRVRLRNAGHILGSAFVEVWLEEGDRSCKLVFSGDLGYRDAPMMPPTETADEADLVLMESTYGDRLHRSSEETIDELAEVFDRARAESGNIIIPSFAVGRTQDLLHLLNEHFDEWRIGHYRVFLDSPLAIAATEAYERFRNLFTSPYFADPGDSPLDERLTICHSSADSMALNDIRSGAIIIAGSGMCTGGRVLHHLKHNVWRRNCHVVIVGFQAYGTLGRRLVDGAEKIRLWGEEIRVNAQIHTVGGLSAHADQADLIDWYDAIDNRPPVCLVHGEPRAQRVLAKELRHRGARRVTMPAQHERMDLGKLR